MVLIRQPDLAALTPRLSSCQPTEGFRPEDVDHLFGTTLLQQRLGGGASTGLPSLLGTQGRDAVGHLEQMGLAQATLANDHVEVPTEVDGGLGKAGEVGEGELLQHL